MYAGRHPACPPHGRLVAPYKALTASITPATASTLSTHCDSMVSVSSRMPSPAPLPPVVLLPPETVLHVLLFAGPVASAHFTATCRAARAFLCSALYKDLFLSLFDPPPASETHSYPYRYHLERRIRARGWIKTESTMLKLRASIEDLEETLIALCDIARTRSPFAFQGESKNQDFLEMYLPSNTTHVQLLNAAKKGGYRLRCNDAEGAGVALSATQLAAQLHVLHTPTHYALNSPSLRRAAREVVYFSSNFSRLARWGPFLDNSGDKGRRHLKVDWQKLEALAIVMGTNLEEAIGSGWARNTSLPSGWDMTRSGTSPAGERDWAGVESQSFIGTYSFLDYRVFEHFNFHRTSTYIPTLEDQTEAVGECMNITLRLLPPGEKPKARTLPARRRFDWDDNLSDDDDDDYDDNSFQSDSSTYSSGSSSVESDVDDGVVEEIRNGVVVLPEGTPPSSEVEGSSGSNSSNVHVSQSSSSSPPSPVLSMSSSSSSSKEDKGKGRGKGKGKRKENEKASSIEETHPRLDFAGTSERLHFDGVFAHGTDPNDQLPKRSIHGSVVMTHEGQVHWKYTISYGGGPQWLMHGVQIGGPKSRQGVVGVWSTHNHEPEGPNGPFWYWPVQD